MSLIDPGAIPFADMHPEQVQAAALTFGTAAGQIRDGGAGVLRSWQQLPSSLEVTGTAHIYSVMDLVGSNTQTAGDGLDGVSRALSAYGDDLLRIKTRFESVYAEATAFVSEANSFHTRVESVSSGYTFGISLPEAITSWDEDPAMSARNNELIREVAAIEADWLDAQQRCATSIRAAAGLGPTKVAEEAAAAQALRSDGDLQTPWGSTQDRKESCSEKAITFQTHFLWDGVIVGVGGGLLKSLGALTGTWDGQNFTPIKTAEDLFSGNWGAYLQDQQHARDVAGGAWLGLVHLVSGLARPPGMSPQMVELALSSPAGDALPSWLRDGVRDWNREDGSAVYGMAGGLLSLNVPKQWWDASAWKPGDVFSNWTDNPGGAAGQAVGNIATFFIPGVGEVAGGTKAALEGVTVAGDATKLVRGADLADSAVAALKGLDHDGLAALNPHLSPGDIDHLFTELQKPVPDLAGLELHVPDMPAVHVGGDGLHGADPVGDAPAPHEAAPVAGPAHDVAPHDAAPTASSPHSTPVDAAPHESTPAAADGAPHEGAPAASHEGAPADGGAPHDGAPQGGDPHETTPATGAPHDGAPADGAPHDGAPADGAPHDGVPADGAPHDGAPADAPHDGAPHPGDDPAAQQPAPAPRYEPRPHDYGEHTQQLEPGQQPWNPGTTNSTELGRIGEALTANDIADRGGEIVMREPQIEIPGSPRWFKPDFLVHWPDGEFTLAESKMGPTAPFTEGQHLGYSAFDEGTHTVVGRTLRLDERLREVLLRDFGVRDPVISRVETYRWNGDIVPDADLAARGLRDAK